MRVKNNYDDVWLRPVAPHLIPTKSDRADALLNIVTNDHLHPKSRDEYLANYKKQSHGLMYPKVIEVPQVLRPALGWVKTSVVVRPHTATDALYAKRYFRPRTPTLFAGGVLVITDVFDAQDDDEVSLGITIVMARHLRDFTLGENLREITLYPGDVLPYLKGAKKDERDWVFDLVDLELCEDWRDAMVGTKITFVKCW